MPSHKAKSKAPVSLQGQLVDELRMVYKKFYQESPLNAKSLSFKELEEVASVAISSVIAEGCKHNLQSMGEKGLKQTRFYKLRGIGAKWNVESCLGRLSRTKPSIHDVPSSPFTKEGSFDDVDLVMPCTSGMLLLGDAEEEIAEQLQGKDLEEQLEILMPVLPEIKYASKRYLQHILERIQ